MRGRDGFRWRFSPPVAIRTSGLKGRTRRCHRRTDDGRWNASGWSSRVKSVTNGAFATSRRASSTYRRKPSPIRPFPIGFPRRGAQTIVMWQLNIYYGRILFGCVVFRLDGSMPVRCDFPRAREKDLILPADRARWGRQRQYEFVRTILAG